MNHISSKAGYWTLTSCGADILRHPELTHPHQNACIMLHLSWESTLERSLVGPLRNFQPPHSSPGPRAGVRAYTGGKLVLQLIVNSDDIQ
jgi:hypothetical protein